MRNNILSFQRNLRKFISNFAFCSIQRVDKKLRMALANLEGTTADLDLEPTLIQGQSDAAICEEHQEKQLLQYARDRFHQGVMEECRVACLRVMNFLGADYYKKSQARLLYARIPTVPKPDRRQALHRALQTMRYIHKGHGPWNPDSLAQFEMRAEQVRQYIETDDQLPQAYYYPLPLS